MYSDILQLVQTTDDLSLLENELNELKTSLYESKQSFESVLNTHVRKNIAAIISKELQATNVSNKIYIEGLEEEIKKMQTVHLTLAYEPDAQSFAAIYQWFVDNVGVGIILSVYTNPNLLGGARVSYKGKYYDGSLVSKVTKLSKNTSNDNNL